ncbi:MAG: DNA repair protein RecO [Candidatus Cloacimonetes bacterium]|nr:DNA repair protein RecO [Candidatus Cloacimonadota bacterium]
MDNRQRDFQLEGIILDRIPYKESSFILKVLTPRKGVISIIAQGARKENSKLQGVLDLMNLCNFDLYRSGELFNVRGAELLKSYHLTCSWEQTILLHAGAELYLKLAMGEQESEATFHILKKYSEYVSGVSKNGIAVFWRLLYRTLLNEGGAFNLQTCVVCGCAKEFVACYPRKHGLICGLCAKRSEKELLIPISREMGNLFRLLPTIGNVLEEITISMEARKRITEIFFLQIEEHSGRKIILKSLSQLDDSDSLNEVP